MSSRRKHPAREGDEWQVIAPHPILGHRPGEKFHAVLEGAHRLLAGTHLKKVQPNSDGEAVAEKEESQ